MRPFCTSCRSARAFIAQQGTPIPITGLTDGEILARPDRIAGTPIEVPKELQRWYDGRTSVTLPNGHVVTPQRNTFLKYYSGAPVYNDIRTPGRFNIDMGLRRVFRIREGINLEIGADAMNVLNNTQLNTGHNGNLGATNVSTNAAKGLKPGMAGSDTFGATASRPSIPARSCCAGSSAFELKKSTGRRIPLRQDRRRAQKQSQHGEHEYSCLRLHEVRAQARHQEKNTGEDDDPIGETSRPAQLPRRKQDQDAK